MALTPGTRLGPYEVNAPIGSGGMGEVYSATDTRLDRTVAIKVLPERMADDPQRRESFEREAKAVSSLNHPHICTLHDVGEQDGTHYLVMELVEGDTLAARLEKGRLPLDQALEYAIQIADALDKAHRQGIVHRDLKPGNIMLTKSGVKLLDFGLAKLKGDAGSASTFSQMATADASKPLTAEGSIIGTLQYMAPEQLEGKDADARTDIFAFGAVVYEMVTGKKAFEGKSQVSLMAAILEHEPRPMTEAQEMTPRALDHVVRTCLAKDPEGRWQSALDLMREVKWVAGSGSEDRQESVSQPKLQSKLTWVAAIVIMGIVAGMAGWVLKPEAPGAVIRLSHVLPADQLLTRGIRGPLAIAPDGSRMAYVANRQIYVRAMESLDSTPIPGTEEAPTNLFFSPDGQWIGYWSGIDGQLKKIPVTGGVPVSLSDIANPFGPPIWGTDDNIVFGQREGVTQVSANGGTPELLIERGGEGNNLGNPQILPDGRSVVFEVGGAGGQIAVQSLESGQRKILFPGGSPRYVPTGHLVYVVDGVLFAVPFDLDTSEVVGGPLAVVGGPVYGRSYALSDSGTLVFVPGTTTGGATMVWVDRQGNAEPLGPLAAGYASPRLSPDGRRVLVRSGRDLWLFDVARETLTRLTFEGTTNLPIWTPDGQHVTYRSIQGGTENIFWTRADGGDSEERLTTGDFRQNPSSWSPDGQLLAFYQTPGIAGESDRDIWMMPLDGDREPWPFLQTPLNESAPMFSPDGNWVAYLSDESGRQEIFVQPFPGPGGKRQISTEGGGDHVWSKNGQELFYINGNQMMAVDIETGPSFTVGSPRLLFEGVQRSGGRIPQYDVTADSQRFLMVRGAELTDSEGEADQINVALNWFEELRQRVPTGN